MPRNSRNPRESAVPVQSRDEPDYAFADRLASYHRLEAFKADHRLVEQRFTVNAARELLGGPGTDRHTVSSVCHSIGLHAWYNIPRGCFDHARIFTSKGESRPRLLLGSPYGLQGDAPTILGVIRSLGLVVEVREDLRLYRRAALDVLVWSREASSEMGRPRLFA